jgi:WhiB family transcriptional regulator, redox-sensing transcriptional regulator
MLTDGRSTKAAHCDAVPWHERALCSQMDPELWFPEPWEDDGPAKLICSRCPVQSACLAQALDANEEYGVWGGLSPEERRELHRRMREVVPAVTVEAEGEAA